MDQPIPNTSQNGEQGDNTLILSLPNANALANLPPEVELATVRHMMQTLFARVDALQQNQARQLAGVHDRLDAVELELPLIQEQGALRVRDLEARMSVEIDQAARSAVEEATSAATAAATAALQEQVAGKFSSLAAQMETQRNELSQMRESKKLAETRLNRAIWDIERLCGNLGPRPEEDPMRPRVEPVVSPYRSRISEHIRKAAVNLASGGDNPPVSHPYLKTDSVPAPAVRSAVTPAAIPAWSAPGVAGPVVSHTQALTPEVQSATAKPAPMGNTVPGFDAWKRQFMQNGEPNSPALSPETEPGSAIVICPRCYSDRTRPATLTRLDYLYRLARFTPHRCRSCSHRFYKRFGAASMAPNDEPSEPSAPEAMETR